MALPPFFLATHCFAAILPLTQIQNPAVRPNTSSTTIQGIFYQTIWHLAGPWPSTRPIDKERRQSVAPSSHLQEACPLSNRNVVVLRNTSANRHVVAGIAERLFLLYERTQESSIAVHSLVYFLRDFVTSKSRLRKQLKVLTCHSSQRL